MRRSLLKLTRLAVTLATQPPSKRSRAFAMSSRPDSTGTPTASTAASGWPTSSWIRSMSWIIRSSTTSTSVPRAENGATRWDSMNKGWPITSSRASTAALKRSRWPTWSTRACRAASAISASASASVVAMGFSISTSRPPSSRRLAIGKMLAGRHRDARSIGPADQLFGAGQGRHAQPLGQALRRLEITIDHGDQPGAGARGVFVGVMSAEMTATDHGRADRAHATVGIMLVPHLAAQPSILSIASSDQWSGFNRWGHLLNCRDQVNL